MLEMVYRVITAALYKRKKFRLFKKTDPRKKIKNRMYYRKNRAKIRAHRRLFRLRNKAHKRLQKQVRPVTPIWLSNVYKKPKFTHPGKAVRTRLPSGKATPKTHRLNLQKKAVHGS